MRVLLLLCIATAGCLWAAEEAPAPVPPPVWHMDSTVITEMGFCGDCHYGLERFWLTEWANNGTHGRLDVRPRFVEAPLWGVHVGDVIDAGEWQTTTWRQGETRSLSFEVGEAEHILVKAFGSGPELDAATVSANRDDVVETSLSLIAPDGTRHEADGPEEDLRIIIAKAERGTWTIEHTFVAAAYPSGASSIRIMLLEGDVVPFVGDGGSTRFEFEADSHGAPPAVRLNLHPHHDHALFQNTDWDPYDSTLFTVAFEPVVGPAPPPRVWNETEIDALWETSSYVFHTMQGTLRGIYMDEPGHNDPGVGGSYPGFDAPDGRPVLPGTSMVRLVLTWEPATDEPALGVKLSPANWPYFFYPEAESRAPGRAEFVVPITPNFWEEPDQTLEWYEPGVVRSYYDIAPYIEEDGGLHAHDLRWHLDAIAIRSV